MSPLCLELPGALVPHLKWDAKSLPRPLWAQLLCFAPNHCSRHASFSYLECTKHSPTSELRTFSSSAWHGPPQVAARISSLLPSVFSVSSGHFVREDFWMVLSLKAHPRTLFVPFPGFTSLQSSYHQWHNVAYVFMYIVSVCPLLEH